MFGPIITMAPRNTSIIIVEGVLKKTCMPGVQLFVYTYQTQYHQESITAKQNTPCTIEIRCSHRSIYGLRAHRVLENKCMVDNILFAVVEHFSAIAASNSTVPQHISSTARSWETRQQLSQTKFHIPWAGKPQVHHIATWYLEAQTRHSTTLSLILDYEVLLRGVIVNRTK